MYAMLELVVQRSEPHGDNAIMVFQNDTLALGNVIVEGVVYSWTLQLVVQIEVCDAQFQHRAVTRRQLLAVHRVVAVECAEEHDVVRQGDGSTF